LVEFIEVNKSFGKKKILNNVNFRISANSINQIIAPQSSGKSTILKMIYGAVKLDNGFIRVFDTSVSELKYSAVIFLRRYLGIIFEDIRLIKGLSVKDNLYIITKMTKRDLYFSDDVIEILSISHLLDKYPYELSLSEQSLVNIARGVIFNFPLVLADEPLRYLSDEYKTKVLNLFKYLNKERGITFLIASQKNLDESFKVLDVNLNEKK